MVKANLFEVQTQQSILSTTMLIKKWVQKNEYLKMVFDIEHSC